jgi:hypothetical protein
MRPVSATLEYLTYSWETDKVCCITDSHPGPHFARNLVSVDGFVRRVERIGTTSGWRPLTGTIKVCIPSTAQMIAKDSFADWGNLMAVAFEHASRLSVIGPGSFAPCVSLSSICIPSSVKVICGGCFRRSPSLSSVTFAADSELLRIGKEAFGQCALTSIILPPRLVELGPLAFTGPALREISVAGESRNFSTFRDCLLGFHETTLVLYFGNQSEVVVRNGIEELGPSCFAERTVISGVIFERVSIVWRFGRSAFEKCTSLLSICIPSSVEVISAGCFAECASLSVVTFEAGSVLSRIESHAFYRCVALSSILLPGGVVRIGDSAFRSCSKLTSFALPDHLASLGFCWLMGTSVREIEIPSENHWFKTSGGFLVNFDGDLALWYFGSVWDLTVPKSVKTIGLYCCSGCVDIARVKFEAGCEVSRFEQSAFSESSLLSILIPASVELICRNCFGGCKQLSKVEFEAGSRLSRIEAAAFRSCRSLSSICIPCSVELIRGHCFADCRGLSNVTFECRSKLSRIDMWAFQGSALSLICIPSSVAVVGDCCFGQCQHLSAITFEDDSKLTRIEGSAFAGCYMLASVTIPPSIRGVFGECPPEVKTVLAEVGGNAKGSGGESEA